MTSPRKVAVITRTQNRPLLLERACRSVASQTMRDFVWVIVNDGGTREEVCAIAEPARIKGIEVVVLHNDKSTGMEAASNLGIRASQSDYIAIHDDDDTWEPSFLLETSAFLAENPRFVGVAARALRVTERLRDNKVELLKTSSHEPVLSIVSLIEMARQNQYPPIAFMFRRSLYDKLGGFDETMEIFGDWDFNLRALLEGDIGVVPKTLASYHVRTTDHESGSGYMNSLIPGAQRQAVAKAHYVNRMLRKDIASGRFGLGYLLLAGARSRKRHFKFKLWTWLSRLTRSR